MQFRPQRAASPRHHALSLAALAMPAGFSHPAVADSATATFHTAAPKLISVRSNGVQYTIPDIPQQPVGASISVDIDAEFAGTIKSWSAWLAARPIVIGTFALLTTLWGGAKHGARMR